MEAEKIKKITVDKFHDEYIKKFKNSSYPLFSIIEFNLHGSCSRRCAFCPRVDEKLWPNLDEELDINFFETLCKQLKELDYTGRLAFSGFSEPFMHSKLNEITLADLSAAEEFLIRNDFNRSKYFAKKVLEKSISGTPQSIRALDILNIVN